MSLKHFSHEHPLILRKEVETSDGGDEMLCYGCHNPIVQSSAVVAADGDGDVYICGDGTCDDAFYLHKKCAELPKEIQHPMHSPHPLTLEARPHYHNNLCICNICVRGVWKWFTYSCHSCHFDVCVTCAAAVGDRLFWHVGHGEHSLTLMQREALFMCDACGTKAEDSSYVCNSCEFWMHKTCALSPSTVEDGDIHHHPLVLTYSLPVMHRAFYQKCRLCNEMIHPSCWLYYCDECTYFAHIKCLAKRISSGEEDRNEAEPQEEDVDEDDLMLFPVDRKESFIHLMIDQFTKGNLRNTNIHLERSHEDHPLDLLLEFVGSTRSGDHPQTLINHWSHENHPLELLQELVGSEQVEEIICNGCVQPITTAAAHPFYACIECNFFLHKFCVELPRELPAGAYSRHPQHPLVLAKENYLFWYKRCTACGLYTNGFAYGCETCDDIWFDVRCCFLPNMIKHQSHNHLLLNSGPSHSFCVACGRPCTNGESFNCKRSCNFQIHKRCALVPGTMRHRWDPHPIPLIYPPFDHQGLIYCEVCENLINTNFWLYHCRECDHSFHTYCLHRRYNVKVGDKKLLPGLHKHTLTFVGRRKQEHDDPFFCSSCGSEDLGTYRCFVFECVNCDMLFCRNCVSSNL